MRSVELLDVLIVGGGAAGLWTLDVLNARGVRALLVEPYALGAGQTIASQGIIHGGLKYSLQGLLTRSAANIREMPRVWRECLNGEQVPNLTGVRLRADFCHLWRTDDFSSRLGMLGATIGLCVTPDPVQDQERPPVLAGCPGSVARLAEPVISPQSFLEVLRKKNASRLLKIDPGSLSFQMGVSGEIREVEISHGNRTLCLKPRLTVLTAGAGNGEILRQLGRPTPEMQKRPLHMTMMRGRLPDLNGHCVDGAKTRVTITSERLDHGEVVWQIGGQLAEDGVSLTSTALIEKTKFELEAVLPCLDARETEWSTYHVDRAEAAAGGMRPDDIQLARDQNCLVAWPTKLALVPELTRSIVRQVECSDESTAFPGNAVLDWPCPDVASPPWETAQWSRSQIPAAA